MIRAQNEVVDKSVAIEKVLRAMNTSEAYKLPSLDGVFTEMLQNLSDSVLQLLSRIF